MKKYFNIILISFVPLISLTSCEKIRKENNIENFPLEIDVTVVDVLPYGFINLNSYLGNTDVLEYTFWSINISFHVNTDIKREIFGSNSRTIFQTNVNNNDFIVLYNNDYYVNENILLPLLEYAKNIEYYRSRFYKVGEVIRVDTIPIPKETHKFSLISAELIHTNEETNRVTYELVFDFITEAPSGERLLFVRRLFTKQRRNYSNIASVFGDSRIVHVDIPKGDNINIIEVSVPGVGGFEGHSVRIVLD